MKELRKLRNLAVIFAALLLVLIGVLIHQYVEQSRTDRSLKNDSFSLCDFSDIRSISISNEDDRTSFSYNETHNLLTGTHNGIVFEADMLNESLVESKIRQLIAFQVLKRIEGPTSLNDYGLGENASIVSVFTTDGSEHTIKIGNLVSDKSGIYVQVDSSQSILIADYSYYKNLYASFDSLMSQLVISLNRTEVKQMRFDRTSTGEYWSMSPDQDFDNGLFLEHRYKVTEPIKREASEAVINLFEQVIQLHASEYLPIDKNDYASYGLDQPEFHFTIDKTDGQKINLFLSFEINGYYYGYISENPYTFRIEAQLLPGLEMPVLELLEAYVRGEYFDEVQSVKVKIKDEEFSMRFEMPSAQSFENENVKLTLNMRDAKVFSSNKECYGLLLFDAIFWMPIRSLDYDATPELANVEATISVTRVDSKSYKIELVPKDNQNFYCFIDGAYTGYIVDRSVLYKDNGSNLKNFGIWDAYLLTNEAIDHQDSDKIYDRP